MPGKLERGRRRPAAETLLAPRLVQQLAHLDGAAVGGDIRRTQVVAQQPVQRVAGAHRQARPRRGVIRLHRGGRTRPLEIIADVGGGDNCVGCTGSGWDWLGGGGQERGGGGAGLHGLRRGGLEFAGLRLGG